MEFKGKIDNETRVRLLDCNQRLTDPARLAALARTRLMDSPREEAFDRLARLAAHMLGVPLTIISLVGDKKQFFKAGYGLPAPYDQLREIPIGDSICRYTLAGEEIHAPDASRDALLMHHPTTEPWGIAAFVSIPMKLPDGTVLGAFCAVDTNIRPWTGRDLELLRELTSSAMTEIQLRMQVDELALERQMREQFVTTLTHDLLNPIGVAKGSVDILAEENVEPALQAKLVRMISDNMDRAEYMIRDLLNVTSVRAGQKLTLNLVDYDLAAVVRSMAEGFKQIPGSSVIIEGPSELRTRGDVTMIRRMLDNLVGNAFKYGAKGQPVTIRYGISGSEQLFVSVHNVGPVIPEESQRQIFEPFGRTATARAGSEKGWGIGLTLVKTFVEAHGGSVQVRSAEGVGTTFTLNLPRSIASV